ncbi:MAG: oligoendopeptidase F, partial [Christensenellales bacterium]
MKEILSRKDVPETRKWRVEDILKESEIESYFAEIRAGFAEINAFRNKLTPDNAIECLLTMSKISYKLTKLYVFVHLKGDEDKSNSYYQELCEKASMLSVEFGECVSFISPTLATFKKEELIAMRDSEKYSYFSMYIDDIIRNKKHLLSRKEEALLSQVDAFAGDFRTVFSMFDNVDVNLGEVEVDGKKVKLSHGLYSVLLQNSDPEVRRQAYESLYNGYISCINTIAANYAGNVKQNYFRAKARKYGSCLEYALYGENIPVKVYDNLLKTVKKYTPLMHKYMALRKKALKLKEMHMYDVYMPIVKDRDSLTDFDDAYEIILEALKPLGEDYGEVLRSAKVDGWIDVEETPNKRSGAYSWGAYGTHPYVLLNHKGTIHDVFTIAHEMGHAMHSYYSNKTQCYEKADYVIFVAEIASTVNEVLLIKHLLKTAEGEDRIYLLSYYVDMIRTTLFRQTMFAEFEKYAHGVIESGEALSADKMTEYYRELNRAYYGDAVITDKFIGYEWARIPHFYTDFYVYKYATGITCAINIANNILKDEKFVDKYKMFLSSGSSIYPMEILSLVDLDLRQKAPYENAMKDFAEALKELTELIKSRK